MAPSLRDYHPTVRSCEPQFGGYATFRNNHRLHQINAVDAAEQATRGRIIGPCGTGKSRIQVDLHARTMINKSLAGETAVTVIASHRLALNHQLCDELVDVLIGCGLCFDILCIGSDRTDTEKYYAKYAHTGYAPATARQLTSLNTFEIEAYVAEARRLNRHLLVVSTYHSIDRLADVGSIDLLTHDEAHNIPRQDFTNNIWQIKPNVLREYFFTATQKVKGESGGMNNEDFYGPVLFDFTPQEALERGEIACPRIHIVTGTNHEITDSSNLGMLVENVIKAFAHHRTLIKKSSTQPNEMGAKVVIGAVGRRSMMDIYEHPSFKAYATKNRIARYAISAEGGAYIDDQRVSTDEFFKSMRALKDHEDALIFNIDILTQGIDLPAITGVMPFRSLGLINLIQLLGRALRLHKEDRGRIYAGDLLPGDYGNFVKPFGHIILSEHIASVAEESDEMKRIIKAVYAQYRTPIEEMVIFERFIDMIPEDLPTMLPFEMADGRQYELEQNTYNVIAACINDELDVALEHMTPQEKVAHILSLLDHDHNDPEGSGRRTGQRLSFKVESTSSSNNKKGKKENELDWTFINEG